MKNKQNEANGYECVLCETGETKTHGSLCSKNKPKFSFSNVKEFSEYLFKFVEYREGLNTLTEDDKCLITEYIIHKKL